MSFLKSKNSFFYLLIAVLIVSEFIVNPTGQYCLNDDWTYAKSVLKLFLDKKYDIGASSASIWTHLMWGLLFTKVFGFSLFILRFSTIVSAIIGFIFLNKLILKISANNYLLSFIACAVILFNPIYFNLLNTYMTDVNFNTLIICCCYFSYNFFTNGSKVQFVLIFVCALFLVLLRQFGIIIPLCLTLACLFLKEKRRYYTLASIVLTVVIILTFKYYEHYLKVNNCAEGYQFSSKVAVLDLIFWEKIGLAIKSRYIQLIVNTIIFTLPFLSVFLPSLIKSANKLHVFIVVVISVFISFWFFYGGTYLIGNVFENMHTGAETFFQTLNPDVRADRAHNYNSTFEVVLMWFTCISIAIFLTTIILFIGSFIRTRKDRLRPSALSVYFVTLIFSYMFILLVFDSYIDRYNLPLFTILIIFFSFMTRYINPKPLVAVIFLVPMYYAAVFGTKDYLTLNFKKAEAYAHLRQDSKVPMELINAGYELNLWREGKHVVSYEPVFLDTHKYLIQYRQEPGFTIYREYEFQRYFPYKKDKIFIFVRQEKK